MNFDLICNCCKSFLILFVYLHCVQTRNDTLLAITTTSSGSGISSDQLRLFLNSGKESDTAETEMPTAEVGQHGINTRAIIGATSKDDSLATNSQEEEKGEDGIDDSDLCLLHAPAEQMSWWIFPNGTLADCLVRDAHVLALDLSHLSNNTERIYYETSKRTKNYDLLKPLAFSAAGNHLQIVPFKALSLVKENLIYLSLRGNNFSTPIFADARVEDMSTEGSWAQFPQLEALKELDISNCSIQYLGAEVFTSSPNLQGLYLAHNKIIHLSANIFVHAPNIAKLDLSYIDSSDYLQYGINSPNDNYAFANIQSGLTISEVVFQPLKSLIFLDVSHTKLSPYSTKAFTHLPPTLQFLSMCYTNMLGIPSGLFSDTQLRVLDLSGNPTATLTIHENSFKGINDTLEILSFENARLHDLGWIKYLSKLEIIKLAKNNINILHKAHFTNMINLRLLDISSNHVGNWYHRIFEDNKKLQLLNLRNNNINMLTTEMYRDFANLSFLALGHNDFICGCELRDLIDIAVKNVDLMNFTFSPDQENNKTNTDANLILRRDYKDIFDSEYVKSQIQSEIMNRFTPLLKKSHQNILQIKEKMPKSMINGYDVLFKRKLWSKFNFHLNFTRLEQLKNNNPTKYRLKQDISVYRKSMHPEISPHEQQEIEMVNDVYHLTMPDGQLIRFNFVLLDYQPENYWCYNSSTNTLLELAELEPCNFKEYIAPIPNLNTTQYLIIGFSVLTLALVLTIPLYLKWWYIKYIFIMVKRTTAMKLLKLHKNRARTIQSSYTYDLFVSYCDRDRDWVLEELLPNIEGSQQISICLHERDFQVGLSILENIIQCMDKSRCFLLVISKRFLSSQWCQFEMYLAQHRLFEARKEHLILIMLEDIPKKKRPKSLQYLMQIKTYIKWPMDTKCPSTDEIKSINEERKLFWIRLNRSLSNVDHAINNQNNNESTV